MDKRKQYMLLLNNKLQGAVLPFPQLIELPPSKEAKGIKFYRTGRTKTTSMYTATIYVEHPCTVDLDEFADPIEEVQEEAPQEAPVQAPTFQSAPEPKQDLNSLPLTEVYGTGDDLIEFEGHYSGEVGAFGTDDADMGVLIVVSDGTLLEVKYGKGGQGIWGITVLKKGTAYAGFEPCDDEEADIYSDIVRLRGDIKFAYSCRDWDKVE